jgi:hypothetical protein
MFTLAYKHWSEDGLYESQVFWKVLLKVLGEIWQALPSPVEG